MTKRIKFLDEFWYSLNIGLESTNRIIFQYFYLFNLCKCLRNIQSLIFYHKSIHTQRCPCTAFFSGKFDPTIPCKINLSQWIWHGNSLEPLKFFNNRFDIIFRHFFRKPSNKECISISIKPIKRGFNDIKSIIDMNLNSLTIDKAISIIMMVLLFIRLENSPKLCLNSIFYYHISDPKINFLVLPSL